MKALLILLGCLLLPAQALPDGKMFWFATGDSVLVRSFHESDHRTETDSTGKVTRLHTWGREKYDKRRGIILGNDPYNEGSYIILLGDSLRVGMGRRWLWYIEPDSLKDTAQ
jgi:hypothetical protein